MADTTPTTYTQALESLPAKRRAFVVAYLDCLNATEAARWAGYANPGQQGSRLLKNVEIATALRLGMAEQTMPREEVLARLTMLATASLQDFISLPAEPGAEDTRLPAEASQEDTPPLLPGYWRLDLAKAKRLGKLGALKRLKWGEHGPEIELHDPQSPLGLLAKHYGLVSDRVRNEDGPPVDWERVPEDVQVAFLEGKLSLADVVKRLQPRD